jgi:cell wall assembly regulator SMI1
MEAPLNSLDEVRPVPQASDADRESAPSSLPGSIRKALEAHSGSPDESNEWNQNPTLLRTNHQRVRLWTVETESNTGLGSGLCLPRVSPSFSTGRVAPFWPPTCFTKYQQGARHLISVNTRVSENVLQVGGFYELHS